MPRIDPGPPSAELPDPASALSGVDLVAAGMSVDPALMLAGYRRGLFSMPLADDLVGWFSPDPRGILPLDDLRVSRSLRKSMKRFRITVDRAFDDVLAACADPARPGHWIADDFTASFRSLHRLGWAHSVEVWDSDGRLAGGLFGIEVGGLFSGESMFHRGRDASKAALVALVDILTAAGGRRLLDVQWWTEHLGSLGVVEVPRGEYLRRLSGVTATPPAFG